MLASLPIPTELLLAASILAAVLLLRGTRGASGYLAAMALVTQFPPEQMKLVALTLNLFVGAIGTWRFLRAGHFDWGTFWPFGLVAIPWRSSADSGRCPPWCSSRSSDPCCCSRP